MNRVYARARTTAVPYRGTTAPNNLPSMHMDAGQRDGEGTPRLSVGSRANKTRLRVASTCTGWLKVFLTNQNAAEMQI